MADRITCAYWTMDLIVICMGKGKPAGFVQVVVMGMGMGSHIQTCQKPVPCSAGSGVYCLVLPQFVSHHDGTKYGCASHMYFLAFTTTGPSKVSYRYNTYYSFVL